ncbi:hypothetical protein Bhyg_11695 [Pseudolycoriella hygida]|uniref:Uncharacterized protein n=1 Tax=Pseudolycoriella hygida TaxID=35572 RepID=A0A9Q0RZU0_9DIPT|nr:hypothetical protein Bhyg_11695 [Pseudolycoriella hygida]
MWTTVLIQRKSMTLPSSTQTSINSSVLSHITSNYIQGFFKFDDPIRLVEVFVQLIFCLLKKRIGRKRFVSEGDGGHIKPQTLRIFD